MEKTLWLAYTVEDNLRPSVLPIALSANWKGAVNLALEWFKANNVPVYSPQATNRNTLYKELLTSFDDRGELEEIDKIFDTMPEDTPDDEQRALGRRWIEAYDTRTKTMKDTLDRTKYFDPEQMVEGDHLAGPDEEGGFNVFIVPMELGKLYNPHAEIVAE